MFKAFTGSENKASGKTPPADSSAPPLPVRRAATLMLYGAVASIAFGIYEVIAALVDRTALIKYYETMAHVTASQASSGFNASVVFTIAVYVVAAGLWWWMARANRAGLSWARGVASALCLLWAYGTYRSISTANSVFGLVDLIIMLIIFGIGGAAIYQMWLPESSAYIKSVSARGGSR